MRDTKLAASIRDAIIAAGLKDGMRISFHHNFRNGDMVFNQVMEQIRKLGIKHLILNTSGVFDCWDIIDYIEDETIVSYESTGIGNKKFAKMVSSGKAFKTSILLDSHGGRASMIETGKIKIDVAFIGAPSCDCMGNMTGRTGPHAFGTMAYSMVDSQYADKVIAITDNLVPYPLQGFSIPENRVDYVVKVDQIGDPAGIVTGTMVMTKNPVRLMIARYVSEVIEHSGLLDEDHFGYQAGAGGISTATNMYLADVMRRTGKTGDFILGLCSKEHVDLLKAGLFRKIMDAQSTDTASIVSSMNDPEHLEISTSHYASPTGKSAAVDQLSVVILGATEVDVNFNCNCLTDSLGEIKGGIGGHSDAAAGAKCSIIAMPLLRGRHSCVVDQVATVVTPGCDIDVLVTQAGIAVNPRRSELAYRLKSSGLPVVDIHEMLHQATKNAGEPKKYPFSEIPVANVYHRGQRQIDTVWKQIR